MCPVIASLRGGTLVQVSRPIRLARSRTRTSELTCDQASPKQKGKKDNVCPWVPGFVSKGRLVERGGSLVRNRILTKRRGEASLVRSTDRIPE